MLLCLPLAILFPSLPLLILILCLFAAFSFVEKNLTFALSSSSAIALKKYPVFMHSDVGFFSLVAFLWNNDAFYISLNRSLLFAIFKCCVCECVYAIFSSFTLHISTTSDHFFLVPFFVQRISDEEGEKLQNNFCPVKNALFIKNLIKQKRNEKKIIIHGKASATRNETKKKSTYSVCLTC